MLGDFVTHERLVRDLVSDSEITAIFVNYTRSPEARYPTAINEAYAATKWVAANGDEINVDGKRLALVGNSAGATIAAVTALMIHDYCCFNHLSRVPAVRSALHQAAEELKRYLEE